MCRLILKSLFLHTEPRIPSIFLTGSHNDFILSRFCFKGHYYDSVTSEDPRQDDAINTILQHHKRHLFFFLSQKIFTKDTHCGLRALHRGIWFAAIPTFLITSTNHKYQSRTGSETTCGPSKRAKFDPRYPEFGTQANIIPTLECLKEIKQALHFHLLIRVREHSILKFIHSLLSRQMRADQELAKLTNWRSLQKDSGPGHTLSQSSLLNALFSLSSSITEGESTFISSEKHL